MDKLKELEVQLKRLFSKNLDVMLRSDDTVIVKFRVKTQAMQSAIEEGLQTNCDLFRGYDYEVGFDYTGAKVYRCIVKTWCDSTDEGIAYLGYNGYDPIERIDNSDYFICGRIGTPCSDIKIVNLEETKMSLF